MSTSEQLRKIRAEHHSKCLKSKRTKDAIPEKPIKKTPISVTPVTQEDNFRLITPQINGQKVPSA